MQSSYILYNCISEQTVVYFTWTNTNVIIVFKTLTQAFERMRSLGVCQAKGKFMKTMGIMGQDYIV